MNQQTSSWSRLTTIATLAGRIAAELEANPNRLLALNPSRRDATAAHLGKLMGIAQSDFEDSENQASAIQKWVTGPRGPKENRALRLYFEEVARVFLGQVILLKSWSDRGIRIAEEKDLANLNWTLSSTLRPFIPLDREGWQLTSRNLYSWYTPEPALQQEIWRVVSGIRLGDEGPGILFQFLQSLGDGQDSHQRKKFRYDSRFFEAIWKNLEKLDVPTSPVGKPLHFFCPTLRDGTHLNPTGFSTSGFEQNTYDLLTAELVQLWWGPSAPPLWAQGTGLEELKRDQLQFKLAPAKPTMALRLAEMEAFEGAFVLEESCVRYPAIRKLIDSITQWKGLRSPGASLGMFQTLVSLGKLRPGGLLFFIREEPLKSQDGQSLLSAFLDKGCLLAEIDLSNLVLPGPGSETPLPKYVYVFKRETEFQNRLNHKPRRIAARGSLRSQIELPGILDQVFQSVVQPQTADLAHGEAHTQIHVLPSHLTQRDWMTHWPDAAEPETLLELDRLTVRSQPLASFATIKQLSAADAERLQKSNPSNSTAVHGILVSPSHSETHPWVVTTIGSGEVASKSFSIQILLPDHRWVAPIQAYLNSSPIRTWLQYKAERKNDRTVLTEALVKFIPVPKTLLLELQGGTLPTEWEKICSDLGSEPSRLLSELQKDTASASAEVHAALFARASRWLSHWEGQIQKVSRMIRVPDPKNPKAVSICWKNLMEVLPVSERVPASLHSEVKLSGKLPPHIPIGRIEKVRLPSPGILLATESGLSLHLAIHQNRLVEILMDQLDGVRCPTWNELCQIWNLPRHLEVAESMASDVLREVFIARNKSETLQAVLDLCSKKI
ncbi:MAG: hypothetical protein JNL01_00935 [Bdellovibrionales bacterium]|nr:hypothetical protein [Bdellovibrionales bacterium]